MKDLVKEMEQYIESKAARSAWDKGVKEYAIELCESIDEYLYYGEKPDIQNAAMLENILLNGAGDWSIYSYGGNALIYNGDIAARLCNPSELRKTANGEKMPNARENWVDVQARALYQAFRLVADAFEAVR
ncbi:MAG: hypothetical protein IKF39_01900 [Oscillospiraceae bacterium]|nr:hypothetical protein [Oscillospiraceae bacterium]